MSDKPSNYDLNDELLSAYLDGELSADERAAVEARLATDPAFQHLLHELRSVSQSVQALPTESLGRDLSDEIIRRARVVRGSPDPAHASDRRSPSATKKETNANDTMPSIRVFGSKRAWIWASMALAAGLLIMIVQSGDQSANKLPPVAVRNQDGAQIQPTDDATQSVRRETAITAAPKSPSPPPATVASGNEIIKENKVDALGGARPAAPMASEPLGAPMNSTGGASPAASPSIAASAAPKPRKDAEKATTELDDASGPFTALPEQVATDKAKVAAPRSAGSLSRASGAPSMPAGKQKLESVIIPKLQQFLVVHVVATPDALKKGSFDRLLADNKIEFVPQAAKKLSLKINGGALAKPAESETRSKDQSNTATDNQAPKTEMVLVEAPAPAIESCLADLNKNANDFVSIAVNEVPQSHDRFDAKSPVTESLSETQKGLSRFSRGGVPEAQKETIDIRNYLYSQDFDKPSEPVANRSPGAGGLGGEADKIAKASPDANGKEWYYENQPTQGLRRARSIANWGIDNRHSGDVAASAGRASRIKSAQPNQSGAEPTNQPTPQRKLEEQSEAKADIQNNNLNVLFVFTSEETPASAAPSDKQPK